MAALASAVIETRLVGCNDPVIVGEGVLLAALLVMAAVGGVFVGLPLIKGFTTEVVTEDTAAFAFVSATLVMGESLKTRRLRCCWCC